VGIKHPYNFKNLFMHLRSFIRGVAVGFILGVLYAPARGKDTRRKISEKASDIKDKVKNTYETVSDTVTTVKNKTSEILHKKQNAGDKPDEYGNLINQAGTI
jgi:gas vesicle protein